MPYVQGSICRCDRALRVRVRTSYGVPWCTATHVHPCAGGYCAPPPSPPHHNAQPVINHPSRDMGGFAPPPLGPSAADQVCRDRHAHVLLLEPLSFRRPGRGHTCTLYHRYSSCVVCTPTYACSSTRYQRTACPGCLACCTLSQTSYGVEDYGSSCLGEIGPAGSGHFRHWIPSNPTSRRPVGPGHRPTDRLCWSCVTNTHLEASNIGKHSLGNISRPLCDMHPAILFISSTSHKCPGCNLHPRQLQANHSPLIQRLRKSSEPSG